MAFAVPLHIECVYQAPVCTCVAFFCIDIGTVCCLIQFDVSCTRVRVCTLLWVMQKKKGGSKKKAGAGSATTALDANALAAKRNELEVSHLVVNAMIIA